MRRGLHLLAWLAAATPVLCAQEQGAAVAEMPAPKHEEHEALQALVGNWQTVMKMEAMPGVPGMEEATETKGIERTELVCDGLWLKSVMSSIHNGEPCEGLWMCGYDPHRKQYVCLCVSSDEQETGASLMNGSYDRDSKTWTFSGTTPFGEMRSTMAFESADRSVEIGYLKTSDGKETKFMEITRSRTREPIAVEAGARGAKELPPELQLLHRDVGEWRATVTVPAPGQEPTEAVGSERVTPICQGRWLWTDFQAQFGGMPFEGHGLVGYDTKAERYVSYWIDTTSPTLMQTSGTFDPAKKAYTLTGTAVGPTGQPMTVDEVLTWKDADTRLLRMQFKMPEQTTEMKITYERKKD